MEVKIDPKTRKIEKRVQQATEGVVRDTQHALFPEKKSGGSDYRREQQKAELETVTKMPSVLKIAEPERVEMSKKKESSLKIALRSYEEYTALEDE